MVSWANRSILYLLTLVPMAQNLPHSTAPFRWLLHRTLECNEQNSRKYSPSFPEVGCSADVLVEVRDSNLIGHLSKECSDREPAWSATTLPLLQPNDGAKWHELWHLTMPNSRKTDLKVLQLTRGQASTKQKMLHWTTWFGIYHQVKQLVQLC